MEALPLGCVIEEEQSRPAIPWARGRGRRRCSRRLSGAPDGRNAASRSGAHRWNFPSAAVRAVPGPRDVWSARGLVRVAFGPCGASVRVAPAVGGHAGPRGARGGAEPAGVVARGFQQHARAVVSPRSSASCRWRPGSSRRPASAGWPPSVGGIENRLQRVAVGPSGSDRRAGVLRLRTDVTRRYTQHKHPLRDRYAAAGAGMWIPRATLRTVTGGSLADG